jgi:ABC-type lipoprotein export system ATPase subunit
MAPHSSAPLIEIRNLSKSYFNDEIETPVLHEINLTIQKGEFVAIMGPSGSGKSTLMHILGFLDLHTGGEYLFHGDPAGHMTDFSQYAKTIVENARALADSLMEQGMTLVSGGTDTHLILVDLTSMKINGKEAQLGYVDAWVITFPLGRM